MDEVSLYDYLNIVWKRRWLVITITVSVVIAIGIILSIVPRTYEGSATLIFPKPVQQGIASQLASLAGIPMISGAFPAFSGRDVYVTVLKSRTISENVCKRFHLDRLGLDYEDLQDRLRLDTPKEGGLVVTCEVPTTWLKGRVPRERLRERTAQLAADITNAFVNELQAYNEAHTLFAAKKNRLYVEDQVKRTRGELRGLETRLVDFQRAHPTLVPPDKASSYVTQAQDLIVKQVETEIALNEAQGQAETARAVWRVGAPEDISPEAVMSSPVLSSLRTRLADLEVKRATLLENFTSRHPDVVSLDQEIEKVNQEIRHEVDRIVKGTMSSESPAHQELLKQLVLLQINEEGLRARKCALGSALSEMERQLMKLPPLEMEYTVLLRDLKAAETVYTTLLAEYAKARVAEGQETEDFVVLDEAIPPEKPVKPRVKLVLAASLLLGLCVSTLMAFLQEGFVRSSHQSSKKGTEAISE